MNYELFSFIIIAGLTICIAIMGRWIKWPFNLRSLYWCGAFSYILLIALPRVLVWPSSDTVVQTVFWVVIAGLFAWILAYHSC